MRAAKLFRPLLFVLLFAGIVAALYNARLLNADLVRHIAAGAGEFAPIFFVAGYALATVLFLPGSILTIAGGALFGPIAGTFYSLTGATLGAALAFLIVPLFPFNALNYALGLTRIPVGQYVIAFICRDATRRGRLHLPGVRRP